MCFWKEESGYWHWPSIYAHAWVAVVGVLCLAGRWLSRLNHLLVSWSPREQVQGPRCECAQFTIENTIAHNCVLSYAAHCMSWCGSQIWRWHWIGMLVAWGYHGSPLVVFNQTLHNVGYGAWPIVRIGGVQLKNLRVRCLCLSWHLRSCNTVCSREGSEQCVVSLLWSV